MSPPPPPTHSSNPPPALAPSASSSSTITPSPTSAFPPGSGVGTTTAPPTAGQPGGAGQGAAGGGLGLGRVGMNSPLRNVSNRAALPPPSSFRLPPASDHASLSSRLSTGPSDSGDPSSSSDEEDRRPLSARETPSASQQQQQQVTRGPSLPGHTRRGTATRPALGSQRSAYLSAGMPPGSPSLVPGSTSRSVSRARPRATSHASSDEDDDPTTTGSSSKLDNADGLGDDEVAPRDRGEELVRKRMKERKRAKRMASSRAAGGSSRGDGYTTSVPPTPFLEAGPSGGTPMLLPSRAGGTGKTPLMLPQRTPSMPPQQAQGYSQSRASSRAPSQSRPHGGTARGGSVEPGERIVSGRQKGSIGSITPGNEIGGGKGTGYFPQYEQGGEEGRGRDWKRLGAPPSESGEEEEQGERESHYSESPGIDDGGSTPDATSTFAPGTFPGHLFTPASGRVGRKAGSVVSDVVDDVVRKASGASVRDEDEVGEELEEGGDGAGEDDDEDEDGEGDDEGVTLRDRQDAINIEHPFGLPIWKPALYKKSRSVTRNAETALHAIPSAAAERHLLPGNILWTLVFGWWLALLCFVLAAVVWLGELVGGGRGGYARTLAGLGWYIGWPFGKYVEGDGGPSAGKGKEREVGDDAEDGDSWVEDADGAEGTRPHDEDFKNSGPSEGTSSVRTIRELRTPPVEEDDATPKAAEQASFSSPDSAEIGGKKADPIITSRDFANVSTKLPNERNPLLGHTAGKGVSGHLQSVSFAKTVDGDARNSLYGAIGGYANGQTNRYSKLNDDGDSDDGTEPFARASDLKDNPRPIASLMGMLLYWPAFWLVIAPVMGVICLLCWGMVVTIPMAKLTWALLRHLSTRPLEIHFRSAPKVAVPTPSTPSQESSEDADQQAGVSSFTITRARLKAGQIAPTSGPRSTVLLCTYRAIGLQYYKYTVGGVNIMFVNLLPLVFFTIFDANVLLPILDRQSHPNSFFAFIASRALIFILSLASVIPLSYFIGMAVASISAQSSIGMGAVINATFGSVIEVILYSIALTQGKGRLVEGSIVGSILAGVLLMPGASMVSGAFKRKEQKFNAKSAGVTSTMLIMAIIGTLTPTLFYQTYGSFQLRCDGCPDDHGIDAHVGADFNSTRKVSREPWMCTHCYYDHPDPVSDPFYQDQVKTLMYFCACILVLSYLIGLWFSLRTHASQIWQNPQQLMKLDELPRDHALHPAHRASLYQRLTPQAVMQHVLPTHRDDVPGSATRAPREGSVISHRMPMSPGTPRPPKLDNRRASHHRQGSVQSILQLPSGQTPMSDNLGPEARETGFTPMKLPSSLTTEDFTRAVAVATVTALRQHASVAQKMRPISGADAAHDADEHGGHEGPAWSRNVSAAVLLSCTFLYALIAEALVDVVDVVLEGSGIDEKFLGVTLFALVPNTTEFMNAMSFALNGNIALSMEIGSAYALQVCLLQIPAMVAFSAFYDPKNLGEMVDTFTLIFPRWDVIAIILSIFLLTYTYIEARSNYHRGSILVLAYVVLTAGFYFAPTHPEGESTTFPDHPYNPTLHTITGMTSSAFTWLK